MLNPTETALEALDFDEAGDWEKAHETVSANESSIECAWVHAYLHRKEGDLSNAGYWYRRAGKAMPNRNHSLDLERQEIRDQLK